MTDQYAALRAAIQAGPTDGVWSHLPQQFKDLGQENASTRYVAAASPDVIRALLAERDALQDSRDCWAQQASDRLDDALQFAREGEALAETLRAALAEAADDLSDWGGYASGYAKTKYDLAGCVAKYRALARGKEPTA